MAKYSVIIPAYQCEKTIADTVRSVLNANLPELEIIIIDDGSTDNTQGVCQKLIDTCSQIRYYRQPNAGVSAARNRGIACAQGEFVMFVDSDDVLIPFDAAQLEHWLTDDIDMLVFGMEFQYRENGICRRRENYSCDQVLSLTAQNTGDYFSELFYKNYFSSSCNRIIRRSVLMEHNILFDSRLIIYEDLEFSIRAATCCRKTVAVPDIHYVYYLSCNQDRAVERMKRISNVIAAADPIADAMCMLNERIRKTTCAESESLYEIMLRIYMDMFIWKMKTSTPEQVRQQCMYFRQSEHLSACAKYFDKLPHRTQVIRKWIDEDNAAGIWLYFRYRNLRNCAVRWVKNILGKQ